MKFKVEKEVFEKFPDLIVAVPVILGFDNTKSAEVILRISREAENGLRSGMTLDKFWADPRITKYLECFKAFGSDPEEFPPSHVALGRRILEGKDLPDINPLVNLYNATSVKYLTPFGGEDLNALYGDFVLKVARGGEQWIGIGAKGSKPASPGELVWGDDYDLSTRALDWRQCERTKITPQTANGYFVMEGFVVNKNNIKKAAEDFIEKAMRHLSGKGEIYWLDKNNPVVEVPFETKDVSEARPQAYEAVQKIEESKAIKDKKITQPVALVGVAKDLQEIIYKAVCAAAGACIPQNQIVVEHPAQESFGDYSTSVAMVMAKDLKKNPKDLAKAITEELGKQEVYKELIEKVEVAGEGFINIWLKNGYLGSLLVVVLDKKEKYGRSEWGSGKRWLIEHTSPNPNKAMHLGHLRNNVTGMTIARLWEASGIQVVKDCIDNNRGIAIAKLMWGFLAFGRKSEKTPIDISFWHENPDRWYSPEEKKLRPDRFVDELYTKASEAFERDKEAELTVRRFVIEWENNEQMNWALWAHVLNYSYEGQKLTLARLGNEWDKVWHENDHYKAGKKYVEEGLKKGVFKKTPEGTILTNLSSYGLPETVVIKSDGTALYITQDLALTALKKEKFQPEKLHWVIGPEQSLALKQMFAVCEQLGIVKVSDCVHIAYGYMSIKGKGKMSSRAGNVVYIDDLLDLARDRAKKLMVEGKRKSVNEKLAEAIGVGAVKYGLLKVGRMTDTAFDLEESLSLEGDSGPYLQYTFARTQSVLSKAKELGFVVKGLKIGNKVELNDEETALIRWIYRFPEVVSEAAQLYAPNLVCNFLFELAQRFNLFYQKHRILGEGVSKDGSNFRLLLTAAVGQVLKNGLNLLGIEAPERM